MYTNISNIGKNVCVIGYDDDGKRFERKHEFKPELYVPTDQPTKFQSFYGSPVEPMDFDSTYEARQFLERYRDVQGFDVCGLTRWNAQWLARNVPQKFKYDLGLFRKFVFDIEVSAEGFPKPENAVDPITAISLYDSYTQKYIQWVFDEGYTVHKPSIELRKCADESEMLVDFIRYWMDNRPDIISGWNIEIYDIPYIFNRLIEITGDDKIIKKFSPWGRVRAREIVKFNKPMTIYDIEGVATLDYIELYKKYTYSAKESYSLDFIAKEEIGDCKIEYDGTLWELYNNDFQLFVEYNQYDVELVVKIDEKMGFFDLVASLMYLGRACTLSEPQGPVRFWENLVAQHLFSKNIIVPVPSGGIADKSEKFEGAYVKDTVVGRHDWVVTLDAKSLYPSIIRMANISPETRLPRDKWEPGLEVDLGGITMETLLRKQKDTSPLRDYNLSLAANGAVFTKDKLGVFPELMKLFMEGRDVYKGIMKKEKQKLVHIKTEMEKRGIKY